MLLSLEKLRALQISWAYLEYSFLLHVITYCVLIILFLCVIMCGFFYCREKRKLEGNIFRSFFAYLRW
jgi:hypothetical protein